MPQAPAVQCGLGPPAGRLHAFGAVRRVDGPSQLQGGTWQAPWAIPPNAAGPLLHSATLLG
eukprot:3818880-Alexandrium_andersonii.AAC.1